MLINNIKDDLMGLYLSTEVFEKILPATNQWSIEYSNYGSYFDCSTKIEEINVSGWLGMYVRFEITADLEIVVTKIGDSRKGSSSSWSGAKYSQQRELAFQYDVKHWIADLNEKGVRVLDTALSI
ncbi:MAG: hypothetical protein ACI88H_001974 [Cocleimonas sp.]|jgi:hypothetical protein